MDRCKAGVPAVEEVQLRTATSDQLVARGTFCGRSVNILFDSGASCNFVNDDFVRSLGDSVLIQDSPPINVRLGDDKVHVTDKKVEGPIYLGDNYDFADEMLLFPTPGNVQIILGYSWMDKYDAWLNPSLDGVELNKFKYRPSKKLTPIWYGPYRVIGRPSSISCELDLQDDCYITTVFPMSKLKLASDEQFSNLRPTPLPPSEDIEGEFELEKILDHDEKRKMYYCKWKNYD
eukprot:SAG11_NODE_6586_length_1282_cov_10.895182_2_plen_232_part_01